MKNKILFITPGYMPINNKKGGGIESLLDIYFSHNSKTGNYEITAYSAYDRNDKPDMDENYKHVQFRNIDISRRNDRVSHKVARVFQVIFGRPCARYYIKKVLEDLKSRNEENAFDLIVVENCENDLAYIGKKLKTKTPIVLHLHNDYIHEGRRDARVATDFLTQVWCVSNFIRDRVNGINPLARKAITIYNAIDVDKYTKKASDAEKKQLKRECGIEKGDYVFLYVGRIIKEKGVFELIKAFRRLESKYENAKLLIVGGKRNDNKFDFFFHRVNQIVRGSKNIKMCGRINSTELNKYYQISDCQIIPSKNNEAFGLVALEGACNGLLILASKNGGLQEALENSDHIFLEEVSSSEIKKQLEKALKTKGVHTKRNSEPAINYSTIRYVESIDLSAKKLIRGCIE